MGAEEYSRGYHLFPLQGRILEFLKLIDFSEHIQFLILPHLCRRVLIEEVEMQSPDISARAV
jgi:hypothetical protein